MRPPLAYHGGKARLAHVIAGLLPPHRVYCEPFAGSLAVLFAKRPANIEMVNDLDSDLVNFWRQLRDRGPQLVDLLAMTPYARDEYHGAWQPTDDPLEQARRFWVRVQQGFAHKTGTRSGWQCSASDGRASTPKSATVLRKVAGLPETIDRLAPVLIDSRPAIDVIAMMDGPRTVHYCDPPYVQSSQSSRSGGAYRHTMTEDDHRGLADTLRACEGTVVLSGYPSPLYDALYGDWHRTQLPGRADTANRSRTTNERTEVLWSNRPLPAPDLTLF
ncbi:MAG: DNA adenine methylase [Egibacteraceae bacterium]